jgi:ribosome biogenesis ATPase
MIDDAMMRPGRLETRLFVDLPGASERVEILRALIRNKPIPAEVADIAALDACHGYSGADLESLIRKAGQHALKSGKFRVEKDDFEFAVQTIKGSVGSMDKYYKLRDKFMHRH